MQTAVTPPQGRVSAAPSGAGLQAFEQPGCQGQIGGPLTHPARQAETLVADPSHVAGQTHGRSHEQSGHHQDEADDDHEESGDEDERIEALTPGRSHEHPDAHQQQHPR